jgi:uncharacterized protein (DUF934 family)
MALIDKHGREIADGWTYPDTEGRIEVRPRAVLPVVLVGGLGVGFALPRPIGALVTSDCPADLIAHLLNRLDLVAIPFPKFRDGRGFTIARTLREKYGFKGDIRAIGHVLPDQLAALAECGFTSILTPADHPPEQWSRSATVAPGGRSGQLLNRMMGGRAAAGGATGST